VETKTLLGPELADVFKWIEGDNWDKSRKDRITLCYAIKRLGDENFSKLEPKTQTGG